MKKLIFEILGITIITGIGGIIYNYFSPNQIPLFPIQKVYTAIADSMLDNSHNKLNTIQTKDSGTTLKQVQTDIKPNQKDTAAKIKPNEKLTQKADPIKDKLEIMKEMLSRDFSYRQVLSKLNDPDFLFIDARNAEDFSEGHIGKAINIDAYMEDQQKYFNFITQLPLDKTLIIYCNGGSCDASEKLAKDVVNYGYIKVFIYHGGWEEWSKKQHS